MTIFGRFVRHLVTAAFAVCVLMGAGEARALGGVVPVVSEPESRDPSIFTYFGNVIGAHCVRPSDFGHPCFSEDVYVTNSAEEINSYFIFSILAFSNTENFVLGKCSAHSVRDWIRNAWVYYAVPWGSFYRFWSENWWKGILTNFCTTASPHLVGRGISGVLKLDQYIQALATVAQAGRRHGYVGTEFSHGGLFRQTEILFGQVGGSSGLVDRFPGRSGSIFAMTGGGSGVIHRLPDEPNGNGAQQNTYPGGLVHVVSRARHALLGEKITFIDLLIRAVGIPVAVLGFFVGGAGVDRIVGMSCHGPIPSRRLVGAALGLLGVLIAFGGAGLAVGLGLFGWWLLPFGGV